MKITILSDTHLPKKGKGFPDDLINDLKECECIIHAGDFQTVDTYNRLKEFGEVTGVAGNVDEEKLKDILPKKITLLVNGMKIGIVHGDGSGKTTEKRAEEAFSDEPVDLVVFGHSHIPYLRYHQGVLLFNPGSPTDKRRQPMYSHGVLTIEDESKWSIQHKFYS
ncbi:metallophosphoesterase [Bacillus sp. Marseille-Q1617]|uniref:metallophosphoesterase family protein n=1 Tax=Bacillus sp. Marseille-Q1617 TaxID=2736887 RepID=UPI00158EA3E7|nr:metallophosphoesterase family protein [Bacillus sp. Marseille-Q1617]